MLDEWFGLLAAYSGQDNLPEKEYFEESLHLHELLSGLW
jgi:hypothetical protein